MNRNDVLATATHDDLLPANSLARADVVGYVAISPFDWRCPAAMINQAAPRTQSPHVHSKRRTPKFVPTTKFIEVSGSLVMGEDCAVFGCPICTSRLERKTAANIGQPRQRRSQISPTKTRNPASMRFQESYSR